MCAGPDPVWGSWICGKNVQQYPIPRKGHVTLEERHGVDEHGKGAQAGAYLRVDPFAVSVGMRLVRVVQVDAVQSGDRKSEDELKESQYDTHKGATEATAGGVRADSVEDGHGEEYPCPISFVEILVLVLVGKWWFGSCWKCSI